MKIAFDSQIFTMQEYGGISRYISNLAEKLSEIEGVEAKIFAPIYINKYLENLPREIVSGFKIPKIYKMGRIFHISGFWLARTVVAQYAPEIVHETYYASNSISSKNARTVVTVYDMIHERFPSLFSKHDRTAELKRAAVLRSDHVICISENTKRDLLELVPISPEKVSVVYLGVEKIDMYEHNGDAKLIFNELPYLLFVGGRGHYKNFNGLLRSYASSNWLKNNFRIICIGGGKLQTDELEFMHELGIAPRQVLQINANDNLLAEFFRGAAAFVYPSMYEGFGIPPLEAMAWGCPVICSNTSSIPEVVGDAGEYFEPESIDSMRFAIEHVLQTKARRELLVKRGFDRCTIFTWERCAAETLEIYRSIV